VGGSSTGRIYRSIRSHLVGRRQISFEPVHAVRLSHGKDSTVRGLQSLETEMKAIIVLTFLLFTTSFVYSQELNERPMYGGIQKTPEMVRIDKEFVDYMVRTFGSRDKAADDAIRRGFEFLAKADWRMAMKRFNQAWLLSPDKVEVTWGFGAALSYEGKFEDSERYFQKAADLAPNNGDYLPTLVSCISFGRRKEPKIKPTS